MEEFLTGVTKQVDAYWTKDFKDTGLPEPRVATSGSRPARPRPAPAATTDGELGDSAAAYCPGDDTIYISEKFATDIFNGALDEALPGSSQGYGRTVGDFAVAYIVAHEYGHQVQDELGLFQKYGPRLPTMAFELQADCYAGTWAKGAYEGEAGSRTATYRRRWTPRWPSANSTPSNPGHHGTPEQREAAWNSGFEAGDPRRATSTSTRPTWATAGHAAAGPRCRQPKQQDRTATRRSRTRCPRPAAAGPGYPRPDSSRTPTAIRRTDTGYGYGPYGVTAGRARTT